MKIVKNADGQIQINADFEEGMSLLMYAEEWAAVVMEDTENDPFWKRMTIMLGEAVDKLDEDGPQQYEFGFDFPEDENEED